MGFRTESQNQDSHGCGFDSQHPPCKDLLRARQSVYVSPTADLGGISAKGLAEGPDREITLLITGSEPETFRGTQHTHLTSFQRNFTSTFFMSAFSSIRM